ncbi:hypothetical protein LMG29739_05453 [Paraburkholderia solisilvae]|uniref:Uncharacterized protein n=1 Tax=Paraburkholderia solisilvae TaxID=624376 RepID=A0A6J5ERD5_9BURK|nr:hypothetical protein LMG29739_05453 [Paraburkholderia solisilvae]
MAIWLLTAMVTGQAIVYDMRRLAVNRVGLSRTAWFFVSTCTGPFTIVAYLVCRRSVFRKLICSVWKVMGDSTHAEHIRRKRLIALRTNGLIGGPVFCRCLTMLESGDRLPKS